MEYSLPYGNSTLSFSIPDGFPVDYLVPNTVEVLQDPLSEVQTALNSPIAKKKLESCIEAQSIGIVINDKTRPIPKPNLLPALLSHLKSLGFPEERIKIFIGTGTHAMEKGELPRILTKEIIDRYQIIIHNCDTSPTVDLGFTRLNTPVKINKEFYNCALKITVGNIEPHHFMGFSGGVKTAAIGLASRETIKTNHAFLTHPQAKSGSYFLNPIRQDIEEIGRKAGIQFSLGTILNEKKQIIKLYFGEPNRVMKEAIPAVKDLYGMKVPSPYDLVIASPGGAPKDINLYQAQKGLTHACRITRTDGWVILLAACPEGSGSKSFESYVKKAKSHQAVIHDFKEGFFEIGPHKAFQIAKDALRTNIILVSDIAPDEVKKWNLTPSKPGLLNSLILWIINKLPSDPKIALLPGAVHSMTEVKK
jgi:nickel-dependent lactate racemase